MLSEVWKYSCTLVETPVTITPQIAKLVKLTVTPLSPTVFIDFTSTAC
jgi:hypothetical protein